MTGGRGVMPTPEIKGVCDRLALINVFLVLGLSVIPLQPRGKLPAVSWKKYQERRVDREQIPQWFGNGEDRNVGIVCGEVSNVVVIDCDSAEANVWADAHLPQTPMMTRTAKGTHRYYRHPGGLIRNTVRLRTGEDRIKLDVRGDGGYVVAPGSMHETGVRYEMVVTWPDTLDALPVFDRAWLATDDVAASKLRNASVRMPLDHASDGDGQSYAEQLRQAGEYMRGIPPAIQGEGGDAHTFQAACKLVRGFGLHDSDAVSLLLEWNKTCEPPWTESELAAKVANAGQYGDEPVGGRVEARRDHSDRTSGRGPKTPVRREDFYAYMPMHNYIFAPNGDHWPAASVNARVPSITIVDEDSRPRVMKPAAWLDCYRAVEQMTWVPGQPMLIPDRLVSDGGWIQRPGFATFNLYRPPVPHHGAPDGAERWVDHIQAIYPDDADHIVAWLAHRVQHPADKINHALVLGGLQGIGKDTILEPVKAAIGSWNFIEVSPAHLLGPFNGFAKSVILRISEARDLGDVNRFSFYDHLKIYTAAPPDVLRINEKHLREYAVFNVCGVIITTNHRTGGLHLPADDRRHYVAWSERTRSDLSADYWTELYRWYASGGTEHVAAYLAAYDLSKFNAKAPPLQTPAFLAIVDANRSPEDAELADALDRLVHPRAVTLADLADAEDGELGAWLRDRKNARQVPHRLETVGYVAVRNSVAKDGLWKIDGRRQVVYAKQELSLHDQHAAASRRVSTAGLLDRLDGGQ